MANLNLEGTENLKKTLAIFVSIAMIFSIVFDYWGLSAPDVAFASTPQDVRITNVGSNSFTVVWTSPLPGETGWVMWGTTPDALTTRADDIRGASTVGTTHFVDVGGLTPSTSTTLSTYYFKIVSNGIDYVDPSTGNPYSVITGPALAQPSSDNAWGFVKKNGSVMPGAIVNVQIRNQDAVGTAGISEPLSSITSSTGEWSVDLALARYTGTRPHDSSFLYSASGDDLVIEVRAGSAGSADVVFDTGDRNPDRVGLLPDIVLDTTGPITSSVSATPNPTNGTVPVTLTASVSDVARGNSNIATAEYFIDSVGTNGTGTAMSPSDGTFNSVTEGVTASVDVSGLIAGTHTLYVHGKDANNNWGGTASTTINIDKTAPTVFSTSPANAATGVAIGANVTATFSEDMDASTINGTSFTLAQGVTPVDGVVSYNSSTRTATFAPTSSLGYSTTYTATVTSGAKDSAGNPLTSNHTWSFTTRAVSSSRDIGIARMRAPKKVKVSGGRETRTKVAITVDNYGTIIESDVLVRLCLKYPDGVVDSWSQNVAVNLGSEITRAVFDIALGASHGLGMATWMSQVVAPMDENSSNDSAVPMYTELW